MSSTRGVKPPSPAKGSILVVLPAEILRNIAINLPRPSNLSRLSRTCKELRHTIQPVLYKDLTIYLQRDWSSVAWLENLLDTGANGLHYTMGISVLMTPDQVGGAFPSRRAYGSHGYYMEIIGEGHQWKDGEDALGQNRCQPKLLNTLVRLIIKRIPQNQLRNFHWHHTTTLSSFTLNLLVAHHGLSVIDVRINNAHMEYGPPNFTGLTTLEVGDIELRQGSGCIARLLVRNYNSLKHLKLGCERAQALNILGREPFEGITGVLAEYKNDFLDEVKDIDGFEWENGSEPAVPSLKLQSLHLTGFDPGMLLETTLLPVLNLSNLQSLSLESCEGPEGILSLPATATSSNAKWIPRLRSFSIRQESSTAAFQEQLKSFLLSFNGLINLSVLLTGSAPALDLECFIKNHGASLRTLVWDQRSGPREHLGVSTHTTNAPSHQALEQISKGCPKLEELGISCAAKGGGLLYPHVYHVSRLRHLRTLNIRNLPTKSHGFQSSSAQRKIAQIIDDIARATVKTIFEDPFGVWHAKHSQGLNVIGFGSTTYEDTWIGRTRSTSSNLEHYLSPRIYHIERHTNIKGDFEPILTQIARGTAAEAKEYSSHLRIFEPYWING